MSDGFSSHIKILANRLGSTIGMHWGTSNWGMYDEVPVGWSTRRIVMSLIRLSWGLLKLCWDIVGLCLLLNDAITIPPSLAWDVTMSSPTLGGTYVTISFWISLVFWSVDLPVNLNTAVYIKGTLQSGRRKILHLGSDLPQTAVQPHLGFLQDVWHKFPRFLFMISFISTIWCYWVWNVQTTGFPPLTTPVHAIL